MSRKLKVWGALIGCGAVAYLCIRPVSALQRPARMIPVAPTVIPAPLIGLGRIEAGAGLVLAATEVDGIAAQLMVDAGDDVEAGATLLRLRDDEMREEVLALRAKMEVQQRRVATFETARLAAVARRDRAERTLARVRAVAAAGEVSADQLDSAETAVTVAQLDLRKSDAEIEVARADVRAAIRDVATADARLAQRTLRAPFAARVLRVDVQPGEAVAANKGVIELAPRGPQVVRCEFDELVADEIVVGANGGVRPLAGDTTWATGRVVRAAPGLTRKSLFAEVAGEAEDRRVREVRLQLDGNARLPFNARVECVIARGGSTSARRG